MLPKFRSVMHNRGPVATVETGLEIYIFQPQKSSKFLRKIPLNYQVSKIFVRWITLAPWESIIIVCPDVLSTTHCHSWFWAATRKLPNLSTIMHNLPLVATPQPNFFVTPSMQLPPYTPVHYLRSTGTRRPRRTGSDSEGEVCPPPYHKTHWRRGAGSGQGPFTFGRPQI